MPYTICSVRAMSSANLVTKPTVGRIVSSKARRHFRQNDLMHKFVRRWTLDRAFGAFILGDWVRIPRGAFMIRFLGPSRCRVIR
jgi:hypothetical protein